MRTCLGCGAPLLKRHQISYCKGRGWRRERYAGGQSY